MEEAPTKKDEAEDPPDMDGRVKMPYDPPLLTVYGSVEDITQKYDSIGPPVPGDWFS